MEPSNEHGPDPAMMLRDTRADAAVLLGLWLVRRSFWTLLWLSGIAIVLAGAFDDLAGLEARSVDSGTGRASLISFPEGLLAIAPVTRIGSGWAAMLLAYPLARRFQQHADTARPRPRHRWQPSVWSDRLALCRALRDWRWTTPVLGLARQRVGGAGVQVAAIVLRITGILLFPVMFALLVSRLA